MIYAIANPIIARKFVNLPNVDSFLTNVVQCFTDAGWAQGVRIGGGFILTGGSPQGYGVSAECYVADGDGGIIIKLRTALDPDVSEAEGYPHFLQFSTSMAWNVIVCPCNYYISRPGVQEDVNGSATCGGVPRVSVACGEPNNVIREIWYSFGDYIANPFRTATNPRRNIDQGDGRFYGTQVGCYNGSVRFGDGHGAPQIIRWGHNSPDGITNSHPVWAFSRDQLYPAYIGWSQGGVDEYMTLFGQLYNTAIRSSQNVMDLPKEWDNFQWMNYTSSYFFGSLWVRRPTGSGPSRGNYTY